MLGCALDPARWPDRIRRGAAISIFLCVLGAGCLPNPLAGQTGPDVVLPVDKILHFLAYGIWAWIVFSDPKSRGWWIALLVLLALFQESSQVYIGSREFEWLDWVADSAGILAAFAWVRFHRNKSERLA